MDEAGRRQSVSQLESDLLDSGSEIYVGFGSLVICLAVKPSTRRIRGQPQPKEKRGQGAVSVTVSCQWHPPPPTSPIIHHVARWTKHSFLTGDRLLLEHTIRQPNKYLSRRRRRFGSCQPGVMER